MTQHQECIDICSSLLRGEISAVETYDQAIEKLASDPSAADLRRIREEHHESTVILEQHLREMGAEPPESSGPWGMFAQAVEGGAKLLGDSAALAALVQGEEHGIGEYRDALENPDVMEEIKIQIRGTLLPRLERNVQILEQIRNG